MKTANSQLNHILKMLSIHTHLRGFEKFLKPNFCIYEKIHPSFVLVKILKIQRVFATKVPNLGKISHKFMQIPSPNRNCILKMLLKTQLNFGAK